jgi:hypothetical protein
MASTYSVIATNTVSGSSTALVTFSGVPSTYTDIFIVASVATVSGTSSYLDMNFNTDTASNYSATTMYTNGSSTGSGNLSNRTAVPCGIEYVGTTTSAFQSFEINVFSYANTNFFKSVLSKSGQLSSNFVGFTAGLWRSTSAISTISLGYATGNFREGSTFTLYGIKAGS